VADHCRHSWHEAVVVGEGYDLNVVGDPEGVAVDRLADAVDQCPLTAHGAGAERQQHALPLEVGTPWRLRTNNDAQRPGMLYVRRSVAVDVEPPRRGYEHQVGGPARGEAVAGGSEPEHPMGRRKDAEICRTAASGSSHLRRRGRSRGLC
jgi:hypothetical protein